MWESKWEKQRAREAMERPHWHTQRVEMRLWRWNLSIWGPAVYIGLQNDFHFYKNILKIEKNHMVLTCVCWGIFRKLLSRDPMLTNLLGVVEPGVEYARGREKQISMYWIFLWQMIIWTFFRGGGTSLISAWVRTIPPAGKATQSWWMTLDRELFVHVDSKKISVGKWRSVSNLGQFEIDGLHNTKWFINRNHQMFEWGKYSSVC